MAERIQNISTSVPAGITQTGVDPSRVTDGRFQEKMQAGQTPKTNAPTLIDMDLTGEMQRVDAMLQSYIGRQNALNGRVERKELSPLSPEYTAESGKLFAEMFQLQTAAQRLSMGAELMSKVVEHATSSTRTVLQTQA